LDRSLQPRHGLAEAMVIMDITITDITVMAAVMAVMDWH
jgi:hypothetical protein